MNFLRQQTGTYQILWLVVEQSGGNDVTELQNANTVLSVGKGIDACNWLEW